MSEVTTGKTLRVSVVYALVDRSWQRSVELEAGATVGDGVGGMGDGVFDELGKDACDLEPFVVAEDRRFFG